MSKEVDKLAFMKLFLASSGQSMSDLDDWTEEDVRQQYLEQRKELKFLEAPAVVPIHESNNKAKVCKANEKKEFKYSSSIPNVSSNKSAKAKIPSALASVS